MNDAINIAFEHCAPVRTFLSWPGKRNYSGSYWSSTTRKHVGFESLYECTAFTTLDRDPSIIGISSQPMWIHWPEGRWFDDSYMRIVGWVGALISLAGVLFAYLIFRRQKRASGDESARRTELLGRLQAVLKQVHEKVTDLAVRRANDAVSDTDAEEGAGVDDLWADVTPERRDDEVYLNSSSGRRRRVFVPRDIPLAVVGALVAQWRKQGLTGRWSLRALRGAFRAEGKGNHPWYLVFVPPKEDTVPQVWKVTRGPGDSDRAVSGGAATKYTGGSCRTWHGVQAGGRRMRPYSS